MASFTGTSKNDTYQGPDEDNTISGLGGDDKLTGGTGADTITGGSGGDTLSGGEGDDVVASDDIGLDLAYSYSTDTGTERDTLNGGDGRDQLYAGYGDTVDGGAGSDSLSINFISATSGLTVDFAQSVLTIGGGTISNIEDIHTVTGSNFADTITMFSTGTSFNAVGEVFGMGGDDHLIASKYTELLDGGAGDDIVDGRNSVIYTQIAGGEGNDTLYGNPNQFGAIDGGAGNDTIFGNDKIDGGSGDDTITLQGPFGAPFGVAGGDGNDRIKAAGGGAIIAGGHGSDTLIGGAGIDQIFAAGFGGDSTPDSVAEHDVIRAGGGDDYVSIGTGDDADGGAGESDTLYLDLSAGDAALTFNTDALRSAKPFRVAGGVIRNFENVGNLILTNLADHVTVGANGNGARVFVFGGGGNDVLITGSSGAYVSGDAGDDRLVSGTGADSLAGGDGTDTADYRAYGKAIELMLYDQFASSGVGPDGDQLYDIENAFGSRYDDQIGGSFADNRLYGFAGADTLSGDYGNDYLSGGTGDDTLKGGSGNDRLVGGTGADLMEGGADNDRYFVDSKLDTIVETSPYNGIDTVFASVSYVLAANVDNLKLTGAAHTATGNDTANVLTGTANANVLQGLGGDDRLFGAGGNDQLWGGAGADLLSGGGGADRFVFTDSDVSGNVRANTDRIADFSAAEGDVISLYAIDANVNREGNNRFTFIGAEAFHNVAGELRVVEGKTSVAVMGDVDGDGLPDIWINLHKGTIVPLDSIVL